MSGCLIDVRSAGLLDALAAGESALPVFGDLRGDTTRLFRAQPSTQACTMVLVKPRPFFVCASYFTWYLPKVRKFSGSEPMAMTVPDQSPPRLMNI